MILEALEKWPTNIQVLNAACSAFGLGEWNVKNPSLVPTILATFAERIPETIPNIVFSEPVSQRAWGVFRSDACSEIKHAASRYEDIKKLFQELLRNRGIDDELRSLPSVEHHASP